MAKSKRRTKISKSRLSKPKSEIEKIKEEQGEYAAYKALAKKAELSEKEIFSPTRYNTVIAGDKARGYPGTPEDIVRRQGQDGLTEDELVARYRVAKRMTPNKYKNVKDYRQRKGWEDIDDEIYKLRLANPGMLSSEFALLLTRTIYSPPME